MKENRRTRQEPTGPPGPSKALLWRRMALGECLLRSGRMLVQLICRDLVDNAVKFTPRWGKVECSFTPVAGGVEVRVADTGCGIAPDIRPRVFERFFQADPARTGGDRTRGAGLGLAIVKHAAERLAAAITLDSTPNEGATVTVRVPQPAEAV